MDREKVLSFRSLMRKASDAMSRAKDWNLAANSWEHELTYPLNQTEMSQDFLLRAMDVLTSIRAELPKHPDLRKSEDNAVPVRQHKRKHPRRAATLEQAGGDPSQLMSLDEALENPKEFVDGMSEE
jgi:hypothetical protein